MANLRSWLMQLGNHGAIRNAAIAVAERRALEARLEATARRLGEVRDSEWATATRHRGVAS